MHDEPTHSRADSSQQSVERLSRVIVAVMTCLGALGLCALLFFPLYFSK